MSLQWAELHQIIAWNVLEANLKKCNCLQKSWNTHTDLHGVFEA